MKVKKFGFRISTGDNISVRNLMDYITEKSTPEAIANVEGLQQALFIRATENPNYSAGIVITNKEQRSFPQIRGEGGRLTFGVLTLERGISEFNLFVINRITGAGLFLGYFGSCPISTLRILLNREFIQYQKSLIEGDTNALDIRERTKRNLREIKNRHSGRFRLTQIIRPEDFAELIANLQRIKEFKYEYETVRANEDEFRAWEPFVKKDIRIIRFVNTAAVRAISERITAAIDSLGLRKSTVSGMTVEGYEERFELLDNPNSYGQIEHSEYLQRLSNAPIEEYHGHELIQELINDCRNQSQIFETRAR